MTDKNKTKPREVIGRSVNAELDYARECGKLAAKRWLGKYVNPYAEQEPAGRAWLQGWNDAQEEYQDTADSIHIKYISLDLCTCIGVGDTNTAGVCVVCGKRRIFVTY